MKQSCLLVLSGVLILAIVPKVRCQNATNNVSAIKWDGTASAGATLTRGNSRTLLGTVTLLDDGKWDQNELSLGADATYGKSTIDGVTAETAESMHGFAQYNRLFTKRLYGYMRIDGLQDGIADIQYRLTLAPGAGYYLIKNKNTELSAEVGPALLVERLDYMDKTYTSLRLAEKFTQKLSDRANLWQTVEVLPQVDRFENYIVNFELGVEAELTQSKKFTLRSYIDDNYNNRPADSRLKNDAKWVTAIAYKF